MNAVNMFSSHKYLLYPLYTASIENQEACFYVQCDEMHTKQSQLSTSHGYQMTAMLLLSAINSLFSNTFRS